MGKCDFLYCDEVLDDPEPAASNIGRDIRYLCPSAPALSDSSLSSSSSSYSSHTNTSRSVLVSIKQRIRVLKPRPGMSKDKPYRNASTRPQPEPLRVTVFTPMPATPPPASAELSCFFLELPDIADSMRVFDVSLDSSQPKTEPVAPQFLTLTPASSPDRGNTSCSKQPEPFNVDDFFA